MIELDGPSSLTAQQPHAALLCLSRFFRLQLLTGSFAHHLYRREHGSGFETLTTSDTPLSVSLSLKTHQVVVTAAAGPVATTLACP
jgi:hypothetical protein